VKEKPVFHPVEIKTTAWHHNGKCTHS